jgi:hypothetical protein
LQSRQTVDGWLLICIITFFFIHSSAISNYELMFSSGNYLRFPTVFHFIEGQREIVLFKGIGNNNKSQRGVVV